MRQEILTRSFSVPIPNGGHQSVPVTLGDAVWYFHRGDMTARPSVATVVELCDQGQVSLTVWDQGTSSWMSKTGVCIFGDERLTNVNVLNRGVWLPRALWPQIIDT